MKKYLLPLLAVTAQIFAGEQTSGGSTITVTIRSLTSREYKIKINDSRNVSALKEEIKKIDGIPREQQRLVYQGSEIQGCKSLKEHGIKDSSLINLVLRLRGPNPDPDDCP